MYYVYELIDPRNGAVFYVGKGRGARIDQHELEALRGRQSRKCECIRAIMAAGLSVVKRKVSHFTDEQEAYDFEAVLVEQYGLSNLTNVIPGGGTARGGLTAYADTIVVRATAEIINRTDNGRISALHINGQRFDLTTVLSSFKERAAGVVERRGLDWANAIAARFNVRFAANG